MAEWKPTRKIAPKVDATCKYCGEVKPISVKALANSYPICRDCQSSYNREHRLKRKADNKPVSGTRMSREYNRYYAVAYTKNPDVKVRKRLEFIRRMKDPDEQVKQTARQKTRNAIRRGDLKRGPCEVCGALQAQAHHDDYSRPLDVRWLCPVHHYEEHHPKAKGEA